MKLILRSALVLLTLFVAVANADDKEQKFSARLSGYNEVHFVAGNPAAIPIVPPAIRGAISTKATGFFSAKLNEAGDIIDYVLSYKGLEGDVTQAHIHFGQRSTVGGIVVWLCQAANKPDPPLDNPNITPLCPGLREGTVKGTITADEVLTVAGQGISVGEFDELVRALRAEAAYANVHSSVFGPGEIRGQIRFEHRRGRGDD
jgi:hypothetical protein